MHHRVQGLVSHATTKWLKALKLLNQIFEIGDEEERKVCTLVDTLRS